MTVGAVELLSPHVDPLVTRIRQLPDFILVFGGPLGDPKKSARQLFLNWLDINRTDLSAWVKKPEDYPDWNDLDGYKNLIDFERDAVCLTRAVILFSESPGSHAELGAFCMDPTLSERLFVIVSEEHYTDNSFIAKGPIRKIEDIQEDSICIVKSIRPLEMQPEIPAIIDALEEKLRTFPKSMNFDHARTRDQFLLIADLIDLFGALTITEMQDLCALFGWKTTIPNLKSLYRQLERFEIVTSVKRHTQRYYIPTAKRYSFLDYGTKDGASPFERIRFKTRHSFPWMNSDDRRTGAYESIHGERA